MAALIPPALVPDSTSMLTSMPSRSSSSAYRARTRWPGPLVAGAASPLLSRLADSSRFISRAMPPIHTARLTPPVNAAASRSCGRGAARWPLANPAPSICPVPR